MLRNLKIWQKLTIAGLLAAVPVGMVLFLFVQSANQQIARTESEIAGLDYVVPLFRLLERLPQHRSAASAVLNGDSSVEALLPKVEGEVDAAVADVAAVDKRVGRNLGTENSWDSIRVGWQNLKERMRSLTPYESDERHTQLIAQVIRHLRLVGDKTRLTTDPELDTFYIADSVLNQIPWTTEYLGQLASAGSAVAARQAVTAPEEAQIRYLVHQVSNALVFLDTNYRSAFRYNDNVRKQLETTVNEAMNSAGFLRNLTQKEVLDSPQITVQSRDYLERGSNAVDKLFVLHDQSVDLMRRMFNARLARLNSQKWAQLGLALGLLFLSGLFALLIQHGITQQIRSMSKTFRQISVGDYEARAEVYSRDELGVMAETTNVMLANTLSLIQSREERDRIQGSIHKLLDEVSGVAAGDLTKEAEVTAEMTGAIADSFNYMIGELRGIIGAVQNTTWKVNRSAQDVQSTAETLAESSRDQSQRVLTASGSLQSMARSIRQVAERANSAAAVAEHALEGALAGGESVRKTVEGMSGIRVHVQETAKRMKRLGESSQEIGEIVQLISDISDRTSILALNASIQAAMAGETGKGFAVVAEEVERLAERATEATKRITVLIKSVQTETNEAISAMEATTREVVDGSHIASEAGERLTQIEVVSRQISDLVKGISEVARQQAAGSEQVAEAVAEVSHETQTTAAGALQAAADIRQLALMVTDLNHSLARFQLPGAEGPETNLSSALAV
jgi:twitching motility protein PilJ